METDTVPSQMLRSPILSESKFNMDPKEENHSEIIPYSEDDKVADLSLKCNEGESSSNDEFIDSALIQRIENGKEELDQKDLDLCLKESAYIKWETKILKNIHIESNDRNIDKDVMEFCTIKKETNDINEIAIEKLCHSHESLVKSEIIELEEVHIKHREDNEDRIKSEKNVVKEFDNDVKILIESGDIKKETNIENAAPDELNCNSERAFYFETIKLEEKQIESNEDEKQKLNKIIRKPGGLLVLHQCPECPYISKYKQNLKKHSIKHKTPDELDWYSCQECPYKTSRKENLKSHNEIHNNLIFKCSKCSFQTTRSGNLKKHKIKHKTDIRWLHCPECSFKTHQPCRMRNHLLAHKSDAFKCPDCPYQTGRKDKLAIHQVKHKSMDKWHSCPLCSFKTHSKQILEVHCRRLHNTNPSNPKQIEIFKCTECPYESGCKINLKTHSLIHDQSNWLQCPNCAYKTAYKSRMKIHQVRHQDENTEGWLRCQVCPYKSAFYTNLRRHIMSHHICSQCNFKTTHKHHLKRHQLKHKKPQEIVEWFFCYQCSFKTKYKRSLPNHMLTHKRQIRKGCLQINSGK